MGWWGDDEGESVRETVKKRVGVVKECGWL
jgi:hypothetical protein